MIEKGRYLVHVRTGGEIVPSHEFENATFDVAPNGTLYILDRLGNYQAVFPVGEWHCVERLDDSES